MNTVAIPVHGVETVVKLRLPPGSHAGEAILVVQHHIEVSVSQAQFQPPVSTVPNDAFPHRNLTRETIVDILKEHGGAVKITTDNWNIYDEIAARLGVSIEARRRLTRGTGESAWRPEVGFCRKDLEQAGVIEPSEVSGRGVWKLKVKQ